MNARLVNEPIRNGSIPYLASLVWFKLSEDRELKDPSRFDVSWYKSYGTYVIDELNELAPDVSQQCTNPSPQQEPAPVPHPSLFPPRVAGPSSVLSSLPTPVSGFIPRPLVLPHSSFQPPVGVPPPGLPPVGVPPPGVPPARFFPTQPTVSYPSVPTFSISGSTQNNPGLRTNPTINAASPLEKEFFSETQTIQSVKY